MTDKRIAVELDADCVWALQQIAETTGESPRTILRVAVGQVWSKFASKERRYREAAMDDPSATPAHLRANVVDLENHGKEP